MSLPIPPSKRRKPRSRSGYGQNTHTIYGHRLPEGWGQDVRIKNDGTGEEEPPPPPLAPLLLDSFKLDLGTVNNQSLYEQKNTTKRDSKGKGKEREREQERSPSEPGSSEPSNDDARASESRERLSQSQDEDPSLPVSNQHHHHHNEQTRGRESQAPGPDREEEQEDEEALEREIDLALPDADLVETVHRLAAEYFAEASERAARRNDSARRWLAQRLLGHGTMAVEGAEPSALVAIAVYIEEYVKALVDPYLQGEVQRRQEAVDGDVDLDLEKQETWDELVREEMEGNSEDSGVEQVGYLDRISETLARIRAESEADTGLGSVVEQRRNRAALARLRTELVDKVTDTEDGARHAVVAAIEGERGQEEASAREEMHAIGRDWAQAGAKKRVKLETETETDEEEEEEEEEEDELLDE